jgi:hypothetical protein
MSARFAEHTDHARQGGVDPGAHGQRFHGEPGRIDPDHFKTSRSQIAHSCIAELGQCTFTVKVPRRTSIRIAVFSTVFAGIGSATNASPGDGNALTADLLSSSARSASTTQRRSRFALTERAIAAAAIDTPGCRHAATASALNAALCVRRRRRPDPCSIVCTCPPTSLSGQDAPILLR